MHDEEVIRHSKRIACSWSGGKDSCLALYRALQAGNTLDCLLTMFTEQGERSRSHGLARDVLQAQADRLNVPLLTSQASWGDYESAMIAMLHRVANCGVEQVVFGDIDIEPHRVWEEHVCRQAGVSASLPLWQANRLSLLEEFWSAGFEARIIVTREGIVDRKYLGRILDREVAAELAGIGVDACGENGEFHTVVTKGPLFATPIRVHFGEQIFRAGCWFQDLSIVEPLT